MKHIIKVNGQEDFIDNDNWNRVIGPTAIITPTANITNGAYVFLANEFFLKKTNPNKNYVIFYTNGGIDF